MEPASGWTEPEWRPNGKRVEARILTNAHAARCTYPDCPGCPLVEWYGREAMVFGVAPRAVPSVEMFPLGRCADLQCGDCGWCVYARETESQPRVVSRVGLIGQPVPAPKSVETHQVFDGSAVGAPAEYIALYGSDPPLLRDMVLDGDEAAREALELLAEDGVDYVRDFARAMIAELDGDEDDPPHEEGGGGEGIREVGRGNFFNVAGDTDPDNDGSER